jgi:hypothetical protein
MAGGALIAKQPNWTSVHKPAAATQATITKAAQAGVAHVCDSITATIACDATAQTPIDIVLRDGASGSGTIIWAMTVSAPANDVGGVALTGLEIPGTPGNAMTLEFSAAGVALSKQAVTLVGHPLS